MPGISPRPLDDDTAALLGVCRDCGIKHPTLHRETHSGMYHETGKGQPAESAAGRRIRLAKERRKVRRMIRLIAGEHVPVSRSA